MLTLCFRFRSFPFRSAFFRLLLFRFRLLSFLFLPFRFISVSASTVASSVFPVIPNPVSRVFFPGSRTRLSVSFLSSFPDSLPQLFLRCLPYALCFRSFSLSIAFFRPLSISVLTTQPSVLSFPFFPFFPDGGSSGAYFPLRSGLLPCLSSDCGTQLTAILFSECCFASQWLTSAPRLRYGRFPLAYAVGSGYSA